MHTLRFTNGLYIFIYCMSFAKSNVILHMYIYIYTYIYIILYIMFFISIDLTSTYLLQCSCIQPITKVVSNEIDPKVGKFDGESRWLATPKRWRFVRDHEPNQYSWELRHVLSRWYIYIYFGGWKVGTSYIYMIVYFGGNNYNNWNRPTWYMISFFLGGNGFGISMGLTEII